MLAATVFVAGCAERDTPTAPGGQGNLALTREPLESLGELPPFIEIAKAVPTFGGFWFNERDEIVVGLTDLADFDIGICGLARAFFEHNGTQDSVTVKGFEIRVAGLKSDGTPRDSTIVDLSSPD